MERKTMGAFMAALRKANGMTQKDLAEKLNVSDKTISRWERDDGAPDLSVIPVLAEVFGVTCDELLRGERRAEAQPRETTAKGEKQRKRILAVSLTQYRNRTFIAMAISLVGLIAAMIGNLGFLRAYIGFFVGTIFYVASIVCQAIFINGAFLSVDDDSLDEQGIAEFRNQVIRLAKVSFGMTLVLFAFTLPLMIYVYDAYAGLTFNTWMQTGLEYGIVALVLWGALCWAVNGWLMKQGVLTLVPGQEEKILHNRKLKICMASILAIVIVLTLLVQSFVNSTWGAWNIAQGTEFHDYGSFVEFMEQDIREDLQYGWAVDTVEPPGDDVIYYDEFGNEISEEEALREEVRIADGTPEGKVVCTFIHRNQTVWSYRPADTEDGLPITVITYADYREADGIVNAYNMGFAVLYCLEALGILVYYLRKRMK